MFTRACLHGCLALAACSTSVMAQSIQVPGTVTAGAPFNIATPSGRGTLYIVGLGQVLQRDVHGSSVAIGGGELHSAGHYSAILSDGDSANTVEFDVLPSREVGSLGFLAKPSRLPVNVHNGISGTVYVFDSYHNLITPPTPVSLQLAGAGGVTITRSITTHDGLAWTTMDSASKESAARFTAQVGSVSSTRIINQVPGDPCSLSISARPQGSRISVETAPVRDCSGNLIPDGTIVTFTESLGPVQTTVDVPLKQGVASVAMPAMRGAKISAASGVVAGNEIRWGGGQ